jgi:hypothetical protein
MFQFLVEGVLHIINFNLCYGMNIQNDNMKSVTSKYYISHPINNILNPLNLRYI